MEYICVYNTVIYLFFNPSKIECIIIEIGLVVFIICHDLRVNLNKVNKEIGVNRDSRLSSNFLSYNYALLFLYPFR